MQVCKDGHVSVTWLSQPLMRGKRVLGDFYLTTAITLSGNNYKKVALISKFMGMGVVSERSFHHLSAHVIHPVIMDFWEARRMETLAKFKGIEVVVAGVCF